MFTPWAGRTHRSNTLALVVAAEQGAAVGGPDASLEYTVGDKRLGDCTAVGGPDASLEYTYGTPVDPGLVAVGGPDASLEYTLALRV